DAPALDAVLEAVLLPPALPHRRDEPLGWLRRGCEKVHLSTVGGANRDPTNTSASIAEIAQPTFVERDLLADDGCRRERVLRQFGVRLALVGHDLVAGVA